MDPITHAASGTVAMLAMPNRPASRWAVPLAALAAASPDVDVLMANTPLQFLLLHRGITHSLFFAPLLGLVLALVGCSLWRAQTPRRWRFAKTWLFMTVMVLLHIWLDCITTYGTMIFVPFSHMRVRLNAVFIIDLLITLPLLWAIWRWRARRDLLLMAMAWLFVYPGISIGLNAWHTAQTRERLTAEGRAPQQIVVLPDAFSPFFWRALYSEATPSGGMVYTQGMNALGTPRGPEIAATALPDSLARDLAQQSVVADAFLNFTLLPVVASLPADMLPADNPQPAKAPAPTYVIIHDQRFGSSLALVRKIMSMRPSADIPFKYMAELAPAPQLSEQDAPAENSVQENATTAGPLVSTKAAFPQRLLRERMRFSDSGRDSFWQAPRPPTNPTLLQWLVGLR
ncbi:MAG TPA: metal-dependent hydrolase [Desulfovibrio sp.]|uniref:metal-dependent hydrolase n=1 Tax=Desulfovibrio sp. TaxID=885 RepID=UPI002D26709F|nr:metal-dependent hydrolase [Desulfovibrio sp.]HZF62701.1 metal-dependent hydrolase [Desulfovibrio sp.]